MDLDDRLFRNFAAHKLVNVSAARLSVDIERMEVDLGLTLDPGRRFALWCLLHMLGGAPDLAIAFKAEADRDSACNHMDLLAAQI